VEARRGERPGCQHAAGTAGEIRRARYEKLYSESKAFDQGRSLEDIAYEPMCHLMRMTLLGDLMTSQAVVDQRLGMWYSALFVVVVCPH
jgi:hypothetical protein